MICKKPFHNHRCGQCMPCRIARRRLWSHRIMLESLSHEKNSFVTLTYSDENLPEGNTLQVLHPQLWLKSLRRRLHPLKIRYFLVGEYGDISQRPHYHVALFGVGPDSSTVIDKTWSRGFTYTGCLSLASAQYIAGYVTKKMTSKSDPRLQGRFPEYSRMSLKPGIGALFVNSLVHAWKNNPRLMETFNTLLEAPTVLNHGRASLPLGRYLKEKFYEQIPLEVDWKFRRDTQREIIRRQEALQAMQNYFESNPQATLQNYFTTLAEVANQKALNMESRFKLFNSKGKIL